MRKNEQVPLRSVAGARRVVRPHAHRGLDLHGGPGRKDLLPVPGYLTAGAAPPPGLSPPPPPAHPPPRSPPERTVTSSPSSSSRRRRRPRRPHDRQPRGRPRRRRCRRGLRRRRRLRRRAARKLKNFILSHNPTEREKGRLLNNRAYVGTNCITLLIHAL